MKQLNYRKITKDNFYEIAALSKSLPQGQRDCVAPNSYSIAEGSVHSYAYYRGIYKDDEPVGFFMLTLPNEETAKSNEDNEFFLWRFMIKYEDQNKHYGYETLNHIIEIGKEHGHKKLKTSCHMGEVSPYKFYLKCGFIDTGKVEGGEQILILDIENK
ncbi:hypothetical protein CI105_01845 [Candidatus Izimaplasma bacterium ZiA1]|uniref:GNAT family N-acetyltransferase n=1 Tax=Candidatus Izimoplasma sp. ZiA1 TaxID=2024899 RepID=UPI000BAA7D05|nr:hypothetical protein CI105_01845 [Candidatus Izimaplasma bacterium ZiA1]